MLGAPINFVFDDVDPLDPKPEGESGSTTPSKSTSSEAEDPSRGVWQDQTRDVDPNKKTRREPLTQFWAFRFTYEKVDPECLKIWLDANAEAYGYQLEKGKGGQKHYQGTFDVGRANRVRESAIRALAGKSFQDLEFPKKDYLTRSYTTAANRYGMKSDTRIDGPWYKGVVFDDIAKELVYKVDIILRPWQQRIKEQVLDAPDHNRLIWLFWEPYGGLGKTTFQKWIYQNYEHVLVVGGKAADMKNAIVEELEKQRKAECPNPMPPKIIIINIPKSYNTDYFCPAGTEEVKDMFFQSGKYHGGMVDGRPPKMLIFANQEPAKFREMAHDRLRIIRLPDGPGDREPPVEESWED